MKKRILVWAILVVLALLPSAGVLGLATPTLVSPADATVFDYPSSINADSEIEFVWTTIEGVQWYQVKIVQILNNNTTVMTQPWFDSTDAVTAACTVYSPGAGEMCRKVSVPGNDAYGVHWWSVRGWANSVYSSFAPWRSFTIVGFTPTGMTTDTQDVNRGDPTFSWDYDPRAEWYRLVVMSGSTKLLDKWYEVIVDSSPNINNANCDSIAATCSVSSAVSLPANGTYNWYVLPWGQPQGTGGWTAAQPLTLSLPAPNASDFTTFDVFADKTINYTDQPVFVFDDIANASWYKIAVFDSTNTLINKSWYRRSLVCFDNSTFIECDANPASYSTPTTTLPNGTYTWYVFPWGPCCDSNGGDSIGGPVNNGWSTAHTLLINLQSLSGVTPIRTFPLGSSETFSRALADLRFDWQPIEFKATWWNLRITRKSDNVLVFNKWRHITYEQCPSNTCTWINPVALANGTYKWELRAWGPYGSLSNTANSPEASFQVGP
jgi:hypothetical protein